MEGADDNIKTNRGGDGDVKDGDSSPDHLHRQGGRISEEVVSGTSTSSITTDGDLEGEEEYLEVHHQFRGGGGGVGSASVDEFPGHVRMMKKSCEITVGEEEAAAEKTSAGAGDDDDFAIRTASKYYYGQLHYYYDNNNNINAKRSSTTTSEIVAVGDEDQGDGEGSSQFSFDFHNHHHGNTSSSYHNHSHEEGEEDAVYVAVSSSSTSSSMDALLWTLNHAILHPSSTTVFLVHVFPQIRHIPTPCKY